MKSVSIPTATTTEKLCRAGSLLEIPTQNAIKFVIAVTVSDPPAVCNRGYQSVIKNSNGKRMLS